jgi:hypothetical protein
VENLVSGNGYGIKYHISITPKRSKMQNRELILQSQAIFMPILSKINATGS